MKTRILVSLFILISAFGVQGSTFTNSAPQAAFEPGSPAPLYQSPQFDGGRGDKLTSFQENFKNAIADRKAKNLPVPESVKFSYTESTSTPGALSNSKNAHEPLTKTITATTVIDFANPQQAGYKAWPAVVIEKDKLPPAFREKIAAGDYSKQIHQKLKDQFPLFDLFYTFGQEPRRTTYVEKITITYPELQNSSASPLAFNTTSTGSILMGKAYHGPGLDYNAELNNSICIPIIDVCVVEYQLRAGFELDWFHGVRLPGSVSITGPDSIPLGSTGNFSASFHPENWGSGQYEAAGVSDQYDLSGYEYFSGTHFMAELYLHVGPPEYCPEDPEGHCPDVQIEINSSDTKDFVTPVGPNTSFYPLETNIPDPLNLGFVTVGMGFSLNPTLTSEKITANYAGLAGTDAVGSGTVTFTAGDSPVSFTPPIEACNSNATNQGTIRLSDFRYYFTKYEIKAQAWLTLQFTGWDQPWGGVKEGTADVDWLFSNPLYGISFGAYEECNQWFQCTPVKPSYQQVDFTFNTFDQDNPVTTINLKGTKGNNEWYTSDVEVTLAATDAPVDCGGGIKKTEYSLDGGTTWETYTSPFTISTEGQNVIGFRSTDKSNNTEVKKTQQVWIDKTPPTILGGPVTSANKDGWFNTNVTVHFVADDDVSGIEPSTHDDVLLDEGKEQSVTWTATDKAGNSAMLTVDGINIDKTTPDIKITSPEATVYSNTDTPSARWSVTDALSGVVTESAAFNGNSVTNESALDLLMLPPGTYTLTVSAIDAADNSATQSVTITTAVNINGLIAVLSHMCDQGLINHKAVCNGLMAELAMVKSFNDQGKQDKVEKLLDVTLQELDAWKDKFINPAEYNLLKVDIEYIIQNPK